MIEFDDVIFPETLKEGSDASFEFQIKMLRRRNGTEWRILNQSAPTRKYNLAPLVRSPEQLQEILIFHASRGGSARGFRFRDWYDYSSASDDVGTPAGNDQPTGGSGVTRTLLKTYTSGSQSYTRRIWKPRADSLVLTVSGVPIDPDDYTIGETGVITFESNPGTVRWGGYFDVPVHFTEEMDKLTDGMTLESFRNQNVALTVEEINVGLSAALVDEDPDFPIVDQDVDGDGDSDDGNNDSGGDTDVGGNPGTPDDPEPGYCSIAGNPSEVKMVFDSDFATLGVDFLDWSGHPDWDCLVTQSGNFYAPTDQGSFHGDNIAGGLYAGSGDPVNDLLSYSSNMYWLINGSNIDCVTANGLTQEFFSGKCGWLAQTSISGFPSGSYTVLWYKLGGNVKGNWVKIGSYPTAGVDNIPELSVTDP